MTMVRLERFADDASWRPCERPSVCRFWWCRRSATRCARSSSGASGAPVRSSSRPSPAALPSAMPRWCRPASLPGWVLGPPGCCGWSWSRQPSRRAPGSQPSSTTSGGLRTHVDARVASRSPGASGLAVLFGLHPRGSGSTCSLIQGLRSPPTRHEPTLLLHRPRTPPPTAPCFRSECAAPALGERPESLHATRSPAAITRSREDQLITEGDCRSGRAGLPMAALRRDHPHDAAVRASDGLRHRLNLGTRGSGGCHACGSSRTSGITLVVLVWYPA